MGTFFSASDSQSAFSVGVSEGGVGTLQMGPGTKSSVSWFIGRLVLVTGAVSPCLQDKPEVPREEPSPGAAFRR